MNSEREQQDRAVDATGTGVTWAEIRAEWAENIAAFWRMMPDLETAKRNLAGYAK